MSWVVPLWLWLAGASLASFGRLAAQRLACGEGLCHPPSHCDACAARIRAHYLVPVLGWLLARGRCANCARRISPWHPCVEALAGCAWGTVWYWRGMDAVGVGLCVAGQLGLFLADYYVWRRGADSTGKPACRTSR